MPVRGRGKFPKPSATFRENEGRNGGGGTNGAAVIVEYRALKKLSNSDHALDLLRRVGASVRPIMIKHGWRLPLLVEMFPKQDNLLGLNVNRGKKIALRLRRPYNESDFIDEESIIETMLHELVHNIRGPHDEIFFDHLEKLTQEWYDLRANRPLAGLGFMSSGNRLGGGSTNTSSLLQRQNTILTVGPKRLGGLSDNELTPQEAAAAAAHRRREIAKGCPTNDLASLKEVNEDQERQEILHGIQVITIEDDDDDEVQLIDHKRGRHSESEDEVEITSIKRKPLSTKSVQGPSTSKPMTDQTQAAAALRHDLLQRNSTSESLGNHRPNSSSTIGISIDPRKWTCQICTLINDRDAQTCSACDTIRPGIAFWICQSCQHQMVGPFAEFWCCSNCGKVKVA